MTTSGTFVRAWRVSVLFVDDDATTRSAYQTIGAAAGLRVELATSGDEALTLARILLPDVIVLDLHLPDLLGTEVAQRLRASARTRNIPIVILSGDDTDDGDRAIRASGCEGHLVKPCSGRTLLRLVTTLALSRRAAAGAVA